MLVHERMSPPSIPTSVRVLAALYVLAILATVALADAGAIGVIIDHIRRVPHGDNIVHGMLAAPLTLAACALARFRFAGRVQRGTLIVVALVLLEELSQLWVPNRTFDLADLAGDLTGIVIGDLLARRLASRLSAAPGSRSGSPPSPGASAAPSPSTPPS